MGSGAHTGRSPRQRSSLALALAGAVWAIAVTAGMSVLWDYASRPGPGARPPRRWPEGSRIARSLDRATLMMLVHPQCPCSRASLRELAALMTSLRDRVSAHVLFLQPAGLADDWTRTDLWESAAAIPGVETMQDHDGAEARRFAAATSGQVILYDAGGRLLFSGGITPARGHSGDSAGHDAILALLTGGPSERTETPVFGCALFDAGWS
jgi:hypothetical protein